MIDDIRFAARRLARRPGLVVAVVGTIALGVGATTAIYSALRAVILRPFPYPEADRLLSITENGPQSGLENFGVALPTYADWRAQTTSFRDLAVEVRPGGPLRITLSGDDGEPQQLAGGLVSMNWFTLLDVPMVLGRAFTESDSAQSGTRLVVLSSEFWRRHFGGDRAIIGRTLTLNGSPYTIMGVAAPGMHRADDLWIPASGVVQPSLLANRQAHLFNVVGRLAPGVTLDRARDDLRLVSARLAEDHPGSNRGWTPHVVSLSEQIVGRTAPALLALMVAVLFVFLIASANVANVLLARGATRAPEFALRLALGANRQAIVRDVLTEASLLALLGGIVGVGLAFVGMRALSATAVGIVPRASEMTLDSSALVVAVGASLIAILIGGLPPAVLATRGAATRNLRVGAADVGRGAARSRTQHGLVVAQAALAIVLLTSAVLLLKSFVRLRSTDLGFQPENVAAATFNLPRGTYDPTSQRAFITQLLPTLSALPGVRAAAVASAVPGGRPIRSYFGIQGRTFPAGTQPVSHLITITPDYFTVLGIRVVSGRAFLPGDQEGAVPVAVVDELFAQRYFPGESALGKRVFAGNDTTPREIVGIVRHVLHAGPTEANEASIYVPFAQAGLSGDPNVLVRAESNVDAIVRQVHTRIRELGPGVPIYNEQPLDARMASTIGTTRLVSWLAAIFGACAVVLACVGVYGVLAFSVAQRTREIGVRIALGAAPARVVRDLVVSGLTVTATGVVLGVVAALWLTRSLAALLNTVSPADAPSFLLASVLFLLVATAAAFVPAARAGRVDPLVALRAD